MEKLTIQQEIEIAEGNIKGLLQYEAMTGGSEELGKDILEWEEELERLKGLLEVKTHENGFQYTEKEVKYKRERYLLNGEIVGLSCEGCSQAFPLERFHKRKDGLAGRQRACRGCNKKRSKQWTKNNPERKRAINKRWKDMNKTYVLACTHNRRAEQLNLKASLTSDMIEELRWSRQNQCWLSGRLDVELEIDHALPLSRGGGSHLGNIILIDKKLNNMKGDQTLFEFLSREDAQELVDPAHVEATLKTLANYNCMRVDAYELHIELLAEKAERQRKKERQKLKKQLKVIK